MPIQLYPHIIADPDILSGKPVVEGTHVLVSALIAAVAAGKNREEAAREHGVTVDDVRAALEFAARRADVGVPPDMAGASIGGQSPASQLQEDTEGETATSAPAISPLGQRLAELREQILASGVPALSSWEELDAEVADGRGERMPDESA